MLKKVIVGGVIAVIVVIGIIFGYSLGFKNDEVSKISEGEPVQKTETVGRNITIALNDGITFRANP
jgi:hypothetical protein